MKKLVCIVCPRGCHMEVDEDLHVTGNFCPRGAEYARAELTHPTRVVTSTVRLEGGVYRRCPVKTSAPVAKERIPELMERLAALSISAPTRVGDVVERDILGLGADLVVTRSVESAT